MKGLSIPDDKSFLDGKDLSPLLLPFFINNLFSYTTTNGIIYNKSKIYNIRVFK